MFQGPLLTYLTFPLLILIFPYSHSSHPFIWHAFCDVELDVLAVKVHIMFLTHTTLSTRTGLVAGVKGAYSHASPSFEHAEWALPRPTGLEEGLTSRNVSDPATTDAVDALLLFSQHIHAEDARVASCEQENVHLREHESGDEFQGAKRRGEKNSPDASGSSTPTQNREDLFTIVLYFIFVVFPSPFINFVQSVQ